MEENYEEFESSLGNVAVSRSHIERQRSDSEEWDQVLKEFSPNELVDKTHFSKIDQVGFRPTSRPQILLEVDGEWKRMFFSGDDPAYECFKKLRYRWNAYCQNSR